MMFLFNRSLKWWLLIPASIAFTLLGVALAPALPVFAVQRTVYWSSSPQWMLPQWLNWFNTPDDNLDAGVRCGFFDAKWGTYINRVRWLLRNVAYGFSWFVLGGWIEGEVSQRPFLGGTLYTTTDGHWGFTNAYFKIGWKLFQAHNANWRIDGQQVRMYTLSGKGTAVLFVLAVASLTTYLLWSPL
jgi:hypothetical protein